MADDRAPSTSTSMSEIMRSVIQNLPAYMDVANAQVAPAARAELESAQEISPQYQQLMADLYKQYGPQLAQTGSDIEAIGRIGAAQTDLNLIGGVGGQSARAYQDLDRELNPEYYATREATSGKLGELLSSINLNDPNPEAERLVSQEASRSGNIATPSATSTTANALSFGNEMNKRRASLGQAISAASEFLQPAAGGSNPAQAATVARPATNTGISQFGGITNPGGQAYQAGAGILGVGSDIRQQQNDINANRDEWYDKILPDSVSI